MNRKKFIQNSSLLALGSTLLPSVANAENEEKSSSSLDVIFLSDVHVKPTDIAQEGMRKAFRLANKLKPDFIINGGDAIMDAMAADKEKTTVQWNVWKKILNEENRLPIFHTIGNHDAWGWQLKDQSVKNDPLYDKAWVIQEHNMPERFYSFEKKNWKFIILDTAHENNGGYIAKIDEQQFAWLEGELKNTSVDKHVCVVSHIPIVSFCSALFYDQNEPNGDWKISRALLLTDARRMIDLFSGYKNLRCCLSGHIHLQDSVQYKNVQYFCNGAVSGNWWNGAFKGFDPAFARFTFLKNGEVKRQMINYG